MNDRSLKQVSSSALPRTVINNSEGFAFIVPDTDIGIEPSELNDVGINKVMGALRSLSLKPDANTDMSYYYSAAPAELLKLLQKSTKKDKLIADDLKTGDFNAATFRADFDKEVYVFVQPKAVKFLAGKLGITEAATRDYVSSHELFHKLTKSQNIPSDVSELLAEYTASSFITPQQAMTSALYMVANGGEDYALIEQSVQNAVSTVLSKSSVSLRNKDLYSEITDNLAIGFNLSGRDGADVKLIVANTLKSFFDRNKNLFPAGMTAQKFETEIYNEYMTQIGKQAKAEALKLGIAKK